MNSTANHRRGFTLIELMLSITILGGTLEAVVMSMGQSSAAWEQSMAVGTP